MDHLKFIRDAEQRTRDAAAGINPCADSGDKTKDALLTRADEWKAVGDEMERLRVLFKKVQDHCGGDAYPRWGREAATTNSRGYLLDICNSALD